MAEISEAELIEAKTRWQTERSGQPLPRAVRYEQESGNIVVDFDNESAFVVPCSALEGLSNATDDELATVELLGEIGLHWEALDVDYTIAGLMSGIFSSSSLTDETRCFGLTSSIANA